MIIKINAPLGFYEIGARAKQEEALYPQLNALTQDNKVFVMCDGIGGYSYGDIASTTVANDLGMWLENNADSSTLNEDVVLRAIAHAQEQLNEAGTRLKCSAIGTTMSLLAIGNNGVIAAHIGDTRIYHLRPSSNAILYRSRDHSLVNDLFVQGKLTREEVETSSKKNVLTRAMLSNNAMSPDVAFITDIEPGDYFFMCSDGVTEKLSDEQLLSVLTRNDMVDQAKLAELQMLANKSNGNRTAILIRVDKVTHEENENLFVANEDALCDKMVYMGAIATTDLEATVHQPTPPAAPVVSQDIPETPPPTPEVPDIPEVPEAPTTLPPEVPITEQPATESLVDEPTPIDGNKPASKRGLTKNKRALLLAGLILLGAILLAAGIISFFNSKTASNESSKDVSKEQIEDTLPDVSIDSLLPEMPADSLPVGSNISVPRAPGISNVTLPNTAGSDKNSKEIGPPLASDKKSSSTGRFDTGSNVHVPRAPKYNGNNTPPYDPYEGTENFGSDVPIHDDDDVAPAEKEQEKAVTEEPKPKEPEVKPTTPATPATPPQRKLDRNGNATGSVPPPPPRRKAIETP